MQAFKVRHWRRVAISMEKSSEKHASIAERGLALMQNVKLETLASPFIFLRVNNQISSQILYVTLRRG